MYATVDVVVHYVIPPSPLLPGCHENCVLSRASRSASIL